LPLLLGGGTHRPHAERAPKGGQGVRFPAEFVDQLRQRFDWLPCGLYARVHPLLPRCDRHHYRRFCFLCASLLQLILFFVFFAFFLAFFLCVPLPESASAASWVAAHSYGGQEWGLQEWLCCSFASQGLCVFCTPLISGASAFVSMLSPTVALSLSHLLPSLLPPSL